LSLLKWVFLTIANISWVVNILQFYFSFITTTVRNWDLVQFVNTLTVTGIKK
jgi:hypothetical protein